MDATWGSHSEREQFLIAWTPAHIDPVRCDTPLEEWCAAWNGNADFSASLVNTQRPASLLRTIQQDSDFYSLWTHRLKQLHGYLLAVAEHRHQPSHEPSIFETVQIIDDIDWDEQIQSTSLFSLPGNWMQLLISKEAGALTPFPALLVQAVSRIEDESANFCAVSYIELALLLCKQGDFQMPASQDTQQSAPLRPICTLFVRPTLSRVVHRIRAAFSLLLETTGLERYRRFGLNRSTGGISFPCDGLVLQVPVLTVHGAFEAAKEFTSHRGFRRSALSRPEQAPPHCCRRVPLPQERVRARVRAKVRFKGRPSQQLAWAQ